ncbi:MAG: hypothetical protein ACPLPS_10030 [bacterium]
MKKEVSPAIILMVIIVLIAVIVFAFFKLTAKRVKAPPPGVRPMPKAPPGTIFPLPTSLTFKIIIPPDPLP